MTLEELFVNIKYRYDNTGIERARSGVFRLKDAVDNVNGAFDVLGNKLNQLTVGAVGAAAAGTYAYQRWSRSMVELSGKAGLTLKQFKALTRESSNISRYTGLGGSYIREMQQRAFSLGASRRLAQNLAHFGGVLHTTRQATGTDAVEAAMALQGSGLGHASRNLQMVHAASQVGGGNVPDYFAAATTLAATAGPAGVGIEDLLAMLTIGSRGGSLSGAAAGIDQFLLAIKREPEKRRGELYKKRTGQSWDQLDRIMQEEGMISLIRHFADNFESGEIFRLFGEKEAIKTVSLLVSAVEDLDQNRRAIATAQERDSIGGFDKDTYREFSRVFDRFTTSMGQFMKAYGEPFVSVLNPLLDSLTWLLNGLLRLNETLLGMLSWLPAIGTGLLVFRKFLLGAFVLNLAKTWGKYVTGGASFASDFETPGIVKEEQDEKEKKKAKRKAKKKAKKDGADVGTAAAAGAVGGFFAGTKDFFKMIGFRLHSFGTTLVRMFDQFFQMIMNYKFLRSGSPGGMFNLFGRVDATDKTKGRWWSRTMRFILKSELAPISFALFKMLGFFATLGKWLAIVGLGFAAYSKIRKWNAPEMITGARARDAQADYFRRQGLPGGEPAPGYADIAAANRALAEAEEDLLQAELWERMKWIFEAIKGVLPDFLVSTWSAIFNMMTSLFSWVDSVFISFGDWFRELLADPRAAFSALWDMYRGKHAELRSWALRRFLDVLGGAEDRSEADALGQILDQSSSTTLAQPTIRITREMARAFGIEGGDYGGHLNAPNVDLINLPTPPSNLTPQSVSNDVVVNIGDVIMQDSQSTDRFDRAKEFREAIISELRNSADYIVQEMDWASP